jgi:ATP-dependent Clp protease ATP-binding subunit ClpA
LVEFLYKQFPLSLKEAILSGLEEFTDLAKRVLHLAHEEAERMQQRMIGSEHVLLGLVEEENGVAGRERCGYLPRRQN